MQSKSNKDSSKNAEKSFFGKTTKAKEDSSDHRMSSKAVVVQLEQSLAEKLIKKQAVADELEDKLQAIRIDFEDKTRFSETVKGELQRREVQLLKSVENIDGYLKEIRSLKCKAEDMFRSLRSRSEELDSELSEFSNERERILRRNDKRLKTYNAVKEAKVYLDRIVEDDLPNYSSTKSLVEYYLVLNLLRDDLIEEEKKYLEEERSRTEQENISEKIRRHPFKILEKENAYFNLKSTIEEIRSQNRNLEQQLETTISTRVKEDLAYYELKKWINKMYNSINDVLPPLHDEPKGTTLNQLKKISDFVLKGTQIVERLQQTAPRKTIG